MGVKRITLQTKKMAIKILVCKGFQRHILLLPYNPITLCFEDCLISIQSVDFVNSIIVNTFVEEIKSIAHSIGTKIGSK